MSAGRGYNPPLQVVGYLGTRAGDEERGPAVKMRSDEARRRMLIDGELVWVYGPRRHDLAVLYIDDSIPRGGVVLRDVAGVTVTEIVRVIRPDMDRKPLPGNYG